MIPKIIHYVWVGGKEKPAQVQRCIDSWEKYCPDYEIKEWNENNFDIDKYKYCRQAYDLKKWAFVSDVIRLYALYTNGGIYMDTDVEVFKPLDRFLTNKVFTGFQEPHYPVTALMGAERENKLIKEMLDYYNDKEFKLMPQLHLYENNTRIMSDYIARYIDRDRDEYQESEEIVVFPSSTFCNGNYAKHHMFFSWRD